MEILREPAGSGSLTVNHQVDLTFSATGLDTINALTGEIEFSVTSTYKCWRRIQQFQEFL